MGVVYLAKNVEMDRLEVLKVLSERLLNHAGADIDDATVKVQATLNGIQTTKWVGQVDQLKGYPVCAPPNTQFFGVFANYSIVDIHKLEIITGENSQAAVCGDDWNLPWVATKKEPPPGLECNYSGNGKSYFVSKEPMNRVDAQALAMKLGGRLLTISSPEEELIFKDSRVDMFLDGWHYQDNTWRNHENKKLTYFGRWGQSQQNSMKTSPYSASRVPKRVWIFMITL